MVTQSARQIAIEAAAVQKLQTTKWLASHLQLHPLLQLWMEAAACGVGNWRSLTLPALVPRRLLAFLCLCLSPAASFLKSL